MTKFPVVKLTDQVPDEHVDGFGDDDGEHDAVDADDDAAATGQAPGTPGD